MHASCITVLCAVLAICSVEGKLFEAPPVRLCTC